MPTKPASNFVLNTGHDDAVSLVCSFPLLDGSGAARDLVGTLADITLPSDAAWESVSEGAVIGLDGSGNGLISVTNALLNLTGNFTLEIAWMHRRDDIQQQGFLDFRDGGTEHAKCPIFVDANKVVARSGGQENQSTTTMVAGNRYHIVSRFDGTNLTLWVNDSNEDSAVGGTPADTGSDTDLNFGKSFYQCRSQILYVNVWSRSLSDADLSARYTDPYRHLMAPTPPMPVRTAVY